MEEESVRGAAAAVCEALQTGNVDGAIGHFSDELRRNLGEVIALFPLPATEVEVESVEHSGPGFNVVIRFVGETEEVQVQTRWKDRDGEPKVVEVSHLSRQLTQPSEAEEPTEGGDQPSE
jgi:hypothetical protein